MSITGLSGETSWQVSLTLSKLYLVVRLRPEKADVTGYPAFW